MKNEIRAILFDAIGRIGGKVTIEELRVEKPPQEAMGEYTTNAAFMLSKQLRKSPLDIARDVAASVSDSRIRKCEAVAPGYVNISLDYTVLQEWICTAFSQGKLFGNSTKGKGRRVLLEYISSNPTGPIHLGNARGGPFGSVLAEIFRKSGYLVSSEFYVNDFGNQVEILGHSILGDEQKQYAGSYIKELSERRPNTIIDASAVGLWAAERILEEMIQPTCKNLGVHFDRFFSERSLHDDGKISEMMQFLEKKGLVYKKEGAKWYRSTVFGDDKDRVLIRRDGKTTYRISDFAYHKDKFDRGFDLLVTVLGADHHSEAKEMAMFVEKILEKKDAYKAILMQFVHIIHGGKEVKMSKRKGTYYAMDDLLEEVGRDAVRFIFLSYSSNANVHFDIDIALEMSEKNPVFSVQYAHARMAGILRRAKESGIELGEEYISFLTHPRELSLMRKCMEFPDLIAEVSENYEVHRIPQYTRELSDLFHSFYAECRIIGESNKQLASARLFLTASVKSVLAETLRICGISAPERM